MMKRLLTTLGLVAASVAVVAIPSSPVQAAHCVFLQNQNYAVVRCDDLDTYRAVRAYVDCWVPWSHTYQRFGLWVGQGQVSTAYCLSGSLRTNGGYLFTY